jgi:hypothetical protein
MLLALSVHVRADDDLPDSKGTDFWLTFPANYSGGTLSLFITGSESTSGTVSINGLDISETFSVTADEVTTVSIDSDAEATSSDSIEDLGIHITAESEVSVYGLNRVTSTTDAYLGLPTDVLGTEYFVMTYATTISNYGSTLTVVGTEDDTEVTITPTETVGDRTEGVAYTITLNQGEVYLLESTTDGTDLTGSQITSDKAIAVFGSVQCVNIPDGYGACDHIVEQLPPTDTWGTSFVTYPLATRLNGDTFRFLASEDDTEIEVNGTVVATLDAGGFYEQIIDGGAEIAASNPILVAQFSNSTSYDSVTSDPFMMLIPPYEQFQSSYTVTTPESGFSTNYINLVVPKSEIDSIIVDDATVDSSEFSQIESSDYYGAQVALDLGAHTVSSSSPFGAFMYGFASYDSYGYPGGSSFSEVASVEEIVITTVDDPDPDDTDYTEICVEASLTDEDGNGVDGVRVDFDVSGSNTSSGYSYSDSDGDALYCYEDEGEGDEDDEVTASVGDLTVTSTVVESENNDPTISGEPDTSVAEDSSYSFTPTATDDDGDNLTFSISNQPSWASFDSTTGKLSGIPTNANVGTSSEITITVSDDNDGSAALDAFTITVTNTNDAPTISGEPDTSVLADASYSFTPTANDVDDGDSLTFSISNKPSWASFNTSTGKLSGSPDSNDVGTYSNIVITVTDESDESASLTSFSIEVKADTDGDGIADEDDEDIDGDGVGNDEDAFPDDSGEDTDTDGDGTGDNSDEDIDGDGIDNDDDSDDYNMAPVAVDDSYSVTATDDGRYTLSVLSNDTDDEGDTLSIKWATTDTGTVSIEDDALVLTTTEIGEVNLSYSVSDGTDSDTGYVTVDIGSDSNSVTITAPDDVEVDANALYTSVDLGVAVAYSSDGDALAVSLVDGGTFFAPGINTAYWQAEDDDGNVGYASQQVTVNPLITIQKDDEAVEGAVHTVSFYLNGDAPSYPVTIGYTVSGTSDSDDHDLESGEVTIESGTQTSISVDITSDEVSEGDETLIITLDSSLNLGSKSTYTLTITEDNVAPEVSLTTYQDGDARSTVSTDDGDVTIEATVTDDNTDDTLTYTWTSESSGISNSSDDDTQFVFTPSLLSEGYYKVQLDVSDGTETVTSFAYIEVTASFATLTDTDSDGDLIPDSEEGYTDSDGDGIADYEDAIDEVNVIQEVALVSDSYLVEADSGISMRVGTTVANSESGALMLDEDEVEDDSSATNIGGIFDFIAYDLPTAGQSVNIVFPQRSSIPSDAVYRKYSSSNGSWGVFVEDANNYLSSAAGEAGYCPPPGDDSW